MFWWKIIRQTWHSLQSVLKKKRKNDLIMKFKLIHQSTSKGIIVIDKSLSKGITSVGKITTWERESNICNEWRILYSTREEQRHSESGKLLSLWKYSLHSVLQWNDKELNDVDDNPTDGKTQPALLTKSLDSVRQRQWRLKLHKRPKKKSQ